YLPLVPAATALVRVVTGLAIGQAFHAASAAFFCLGPIALYLLTNLITHRRWISFLAAFGYSVVSPTAFLIPSIRLDMGSPLQLRRLHLVMVYGATPEMAALSLLPLATLSLYLAITRTGFRTWLAACVSSAAVALANAFGAVTLGLAACCLLCCIETRRFRRNL